MDRDPDALHDDAPVARIEIVLRRSGAMSVAGSIGDETYALAMLDTARDTVKGYHARKGGQIIVPAHDTALVQ